MDSYETILPGTKKAGSVWPRVIEEATEITECSICDCEALHHNLGCDINAQFNTGYI